MRGSAGSSLIHTGIGVPQYRFREMDQSRAPSSHLPNCPCLMCSGTQVICSFSSTIRSRNWLTEMNQRSEEHTSELQSRFDLVCRLLLEKKNKTFIEETHHL